MEEKGYDNSMDVVYHQTNGYIFSYSCISDSTVAFHFVQVPIEAETLDKADLSILKQALKKVGFVSCDKNVLRVKAKGKPFGGMKAMVACMDQITEILMVQLPELRIRPYDHCILCGADHNDVMVRESDSVCFPVHTTCKEQKAQQILNEVAINQEEGNYGLAILGALVGGVVGSIPSFFAAYMMQIVSGWLFMLIPLAAYFGYKKAKGILNKAVPFLIAGISFVCTAVLMLVLEYAWIVEEFGMVPMGDYLELIFHPQVFPLVLQDAFMPFLFCIIGVAFSWRSINRTNKHRLQQVEALRGADKQPANVE